MGRVERRAGRCCNRRGVLEGVASYADRKRGEAVDGIE